MPKFKILGISASLRNARRGLGNVSLVDELKKIENDKDLQVFLKQEAKTHLENFIEAGRKAEAPFDILYKNLRLLKGDRGLSNSEVALAAALWSAHRLGLDIDHISLSEYFSENKDTNIGELKAKLLASDGYIISGPVYFGDRSSLAQTWTEMIRNDSDLMNALQGRVYAGIAVGAKRNGGQETTLIYQMMDMINCGLLGVGNDSETTAQYGGTGHAGDVGTMADDTYGINTSMGTGRRIARVVQMLKSVQNENMGGKPKALFFILQDKDNTARSAVEKLVEDNKDLCDAAIIDVHRKKVIRCLACDVCPTNIDLDEIYRCIIKGKTDDMSGLHSSFLDADAIFPVAFSPKDRSGLITNYQKFMERTRYLRRGDYILSDIISCPLVVEELGANENMQIRMMTSTLRHHMIMIKPLTLYLNNGSFLNTRDFGSDFVRVMKEARRVAAARLLAYSSNVNHLKYKPVGYVLSTVKDKEDEKLMKRQAMIEKRMSRARRSIEERLGEPVI